MASMDTDHIAQFFARICGLDNGSGYSDLIARARIKIERALTVDELTSAQAVSCEYAAACEAAYEYALESASRERLGMSEKGSILRRSGSSLTADSADRMRKHAFAELSGIAKLEGFVFEAMED